MSKNVKILIVILLITIAAIVYFDYWQIITLYIKASLKGFIIGFFKKLFALGWFGATYKAFYRFFLEHMLIPCSKRHFFGQASNDISLLTSYYYAKFLGLSRTKKILIMMTGAPAYGAFKFMSKILTAVGLNKLFSLIVGIFLSARSIFFSLFDNIFWPMVQFIISWAIFDLIEKYFKKYFGSTFNVIHSFTTNIFKRTSSLFVFRLKARLRLFSRKIHRFTIKKLGPEEYELKLSQLKIKNIGKAKKRKAKSRLRNRKIKKLTKTIKKPMLITFKVISIVLIVYITTS